MVNIYIDNRLIVISVHYIQVNFGASLRSVPSTVVVEQETGQKIVQHFVKEPDITKNIVTLTTAKVL